MSTTDSTRSLDTPSPWAVDPVSLRVLSELLVKHYDLHSGRYDLLIEFRIGTGAVGPDETSTLPGAMIGVSRIGLAPSQKDGPTTVDAALVNPPKTARKKPPKAPSDR